MRTSLPNLFRDAARCCSSLSTFFLPLIAAVFISVNIQAQSVQPELVKVCSITDFSDASNGHALHLANVPGISDNKYEFFPDAPGTLELFSDGTARLKGRVRNKTNQTFVWDIDFHYTGGSDWTTWSAGGGDYKDEANLAGSNYLDWDYFIFDASESNTLTGVDGLVGSSLTVTHMPADFEFGLQIGTAANSKNANDGASVWFFINGTVLGNPVNNGHGDLNLNTACSEILTSCPLEQYAAGDHILWLPGVAAGSDWVPAPFGVYFAELAGGEARLYGEIQNQNNPSLVLCIDFWFSDKADFATWSGLGRGIKGNPSNINGNEVNWDFYIFNPNRVSSLSGCSPSTLGSYITVEHNPADYNFGLQVGLGANDKNSQFGLSTWFFTEGVFQGNAVDGHGDVNSIDLCPPPPNIVCIENPPIITCPSDTTVDCSADTAPEFLGEATADRPTTECPLDVAIFFEDDINVNGCETVITRTWTVIDEYDNIVSCDQLITVVDTIAPTLLMPAETEGDITCSDISLEDAQGFANGTLTQAERQAFLQTARQLFIDNGLVPLGTEDDCNGSDWDEVSIEVTLSDSCDALATLICTFVAVDDCDNSSEPIATSLNITDNTPPVITCPVDAVVDCGADTSPAATGEATATDDCGQEIVLSSSDAVSGTCPEVITRTWTATDACGNTASCDQVITVTDTESPVFDPYDVELTADCSDDIQGASLTATDNCSTPTVVCFEGNQSLEVSGPCTPFDMDRPQESSPRTGWFPNMPGTSGSGSKLFTLEEGTYTRFDNGTVHFYGTLAAVDNDQLAWQFSIWLRGGYDWTEWSGLGRDYKDEGIAGTNYLDWLYYEMDDTKPNVMAGIRGYAGSYLTLTHDPPNYNYGFQVGQSANVFTETFGISGWMKYTGTIQYDGESYSRSNQQCDFNLNLNCGPSLITQCESTLVNTCIATDDCGNFTVATQTTTITDTTGPVITCPADAVVSCNDDTSPSALGMATAEDDCNDVIDISFEDGTVTGTCPEVFTRTWTATDACGNTSSCDQLITVADNEAPVKDPNCEEPPMTFFTSDGADCPADAVIDVEVGDEIDETGLFTIAGLDLGTMNMMLAPCFSDNCTNDLTYVVRSVDNGDPAEECSKTLVVEIEAVDDCGNVSVDALVCTFIIEDDEAPVKDPTCEEPPMTLLTSEGAVCPEDAVVDLQAGDVIDEDALFTVAGIDMGAMNAQLPACFSDNCANDLTYIVRSVDNGGTQECSKTITIEIEAADNCGNVSADVLVCTFIVVDDEAPVKDPNCEEPPMTFFTSDGADCPADAVIDVEVGDEIDETGLFTIAGLDLGTMNMMLAPCFSDNCADDLTYLVRSVDNGDPSETCSKTLVVEIEAVDNCGNVSIDALVCTFIIEDDVAPELEMPADLDGDITCSDISLEDAQGFANGTLTPEEEAAFLDAAAALFVSNGLIPVGTSDDCNTSDWEEISIEVTLSDSCDALATLICTFVAEDACGNVSEPIATTLNITDNTPPVITCPADVEVDCSADNSPASTGMATATDDCGQEVAVDFADSGLSGDGCVNTFTRTWTATDACGNTSTCAQVITITDTTAPELEMPQELNGDITCSDISLQDAQGFANGTLTQPERQAFLQAARALFVSNGLVPLGTSDDCNGSDWEEVSVEVELSDSCDALATLICTFVAVDDCGNTSDETATTLTIQDNTPPVITCPSDATVSCTDDISPAALGTATATDDCGQEVTVDFADSEVSGTCPEVFTRTWTATDACGNTSTCAQVITIADEEAPVFDLACQFDFEFFTSQGVDCPSDAGFSFAEGDEFPVTEGYNIAGVDIPSLLGCVTDNCTADENIIIRAAVITETGDGCSTTFTVDFEALDECGNVGGGFSCNYTITDDVAPELEMPADLDGDITCSDISLEDAQGFANGTLTPEEEAAFLDAAAALFVSNGLIPVGTSDDCNTSDWVEVSIDVTLGDDCDIATLTCTFVAEDACGNVSEPIATTLNIIDNTPPVITCPADVEVDCSADNSPASTGMATATDDCGQEVAVDFADSGLSGDGCVNTFTRTWTATDACGNTSTCAQVITITDTTAPELEMPQELNGDITCSDISLQDAQGFANGTLTQPERQAFLQAARALFVSNGLVPLGTSDDCNGSDWEEVSVEVELSDSCDALATLICTFVAVDDCGNTSDETATTLTIQDNTPPVITCPSDATVSCTDDISPAALGTATATDDCGQEVTVDFADSEVSGTCPEVFTRTWTATDACGNASTCAQIITIADEEAPVINPACQLDFELFTSQGFDCPSDAGFSFAEGDEFSVFDGYTFAGAGLGAFIGCVTDNCTADENITMRVALITETGDDCSKSFTVDWEAIDECGNVGGDFTCNYTITDDVAPELEMPQELNGDITCSDISLQDAQGFANGTLTQPERQAFLQAARALFVSNGLVPLGTSDDCNGSDWEEVSVEVELSDSCDALATLICTFVAVDDCGNTSDETATTLTIQDNTPPVITCPSDATVSCTDDISPAALGTATATDDCGQEVTVDFADSEVSGTCPEVFTRTWTATDACGNTSTCAQVITIADEEAPVFDLACQFDFEFFTSQGVDCPSDAGFSFAEGDEFPVTEGYNIAGVDIPSLLGCVTDNCTADENIIIRAAVITETGDGCSTTFTVDFEALDECGNVGGGFSCNYTITDDVAPELEMPADLDGDITCSDISLEDAQGFANGTLTPEEEAAFLDAAAALFVSNGLIPVGTSDDCNTSDWVEVSIDVTLGDDCDIATLTCTFVAEDACGNVSEPIATTLNIIDNTPPVITCPADVEVDCSADNSPASTGMATATDDCGQEVAVDFADSGLSGDGCVNTFTRTWTATDACGNTSTCAQVITITDTTAPELEMPQELNGDITCSDISLQDAQGFANGTLTQPERQAFLQAARALFVSNGLVPLGTSDDCNGSDWEEVSVEVELSDSCDALATLICTFVAVDDCGNTSDETATTLTIQDNTPPVITCPSDATVSCTDDISPAALGTATATDDCGQEVTVDFADSEVSGTCPEVFTRTWTATDACGNTSTCAQVITIADEEAPVFDLACQFDFEFFTSQGVDCPSDAGFSFAEGDEFPVTEGYNIAGVDIPSLLGCVTDNCTADENIIIRAAVITETGDGCSTTFTVDFEALDECGNVGGGFSCNYTITDDVAPELEMPADLDGDITCSDISLEDAQGFANGTLTPEEEAAFLDAAAALFVSNGLIPVGTSDDCNTSDWVEVSIDVTLGDDCDIATLTCTFVAEDACGNVSEPIATTLNIIDNTPPVITCPADVEVDCSADNSPASTGMATATDDCGQEVAVDFADSGLSGDGCVNTFTRTWTATDACGNTSTCAQVITITDTTAPELEMPQELNGDITCSDISLQDAQGFANGTLTQPERQAFLQAARALFVSNGLVPLGTSDDCNGSDWEEVSVEVELSDSCDALATLICTFVAVDDCGNTSDETATTLTIQDNTPPVITCPSDATVSCTDDISPAALGTATATDDCGQEVTVDFADSEVSGTCPEVFTRTWTATDACGNASTCAQVITIADEEAPVFDLACQFDFEFFTSQGVDCPSDAGFSFAEGDEFPVTEGYNIAGVDIPSLLGCVTDNCTADENIIIRAAVITETGDGCSTTFTVDFEALDECGNVGGGFSCNYTITDDVAPELEMPQDLDGDITCSDISLQDAQGFANGTLTPEEEAAFLDAAAALFVSNGLIPVGTSDDCNTSDWEEISIEVTLSDSCDALATLICTFVAEDACGNVSEPIATTLNIIDNTPPVITCPADVEVDCTADNSPASTGMATATDDCGQEVAVDFADSGLSGDGCVNTFTRTWTATDACGNTSTCAQVITITDTTAPELIMPEESSIHITCMAVDYAMLLDYVDGNLSNTQMNVYESFLAGIFMQNGLIPTEAIDDCNDASFYETGIEISTDVECPAKATVRCVFVAVDDCGNESDPVYTELVVVDNTTPHIFCPADIVVTCGSDTSPAVTGFASATDNCIGIMDVTYEDLYVSEICPSSFIRLWTATDDCGNVATCEQLITTVEEGDCVTAPNGLEAEAIGSNTIHFSWNPVPNSVACRVFGRPAGGNANITLGTIVGAEPSELTFSSGQLQDGLLIEWRVICACELSPLMTSPYSPWTQFYFLTDDNKSNDSASSEGEQLQGELYPNPTRSTVFINSEFKEGETLTVMDLSGKVVGQYNVPVASGMFEINLAELEGGVYFIQHAGLDGRSQTFKVVKNN